MRQVFLHYQCHRYETAWGTLSILQGVAETNTAFSYLCTHHYMSVTDERIQPMVHSTWQLASKKLINVF